MRIRSTLTTPLRPAPGDHLAAHLLEALTRPIVPVATAGLALTAVVDSRLPPFLWFVGGLVLLAFADHRTPEPAWRPDLMTALGLWPVHQHAAPPLTPLLRIASRRTVRGGRDDRCELLFFRRSAVAHDPNGRGRPDAPYVTAVLVRDHTPARLRFLAAQPRQGAVMQAAARPVRSFAGQPDRDVVPVTLESVAFHDRFDVQCAREHVDRARQVLTPTMLVRLTELGLAFEYELGNLVVYEDRFTDDVAELRELMAAAVEIAAAIRVDAGLTPRS